MKSVLLFCLFFVSQWGAAQELDTKQFLGNWKVTVSGEDRQRLLKITDIGRLENGTYPAHAVYGWIDAGQAPIPLTLSNQQGTFHLDFTTPPGSKVAARQESSLLFLGTFSTGKKKVDVKLERISEEEVSEIQTKARSISFEKPGPDVPLECSKWFGTWEGLLHNDRGVSNLWIAHVNKDCKVTFAYYRPEVARPVASRTGTIKDGLLTIPCANNGYCVFTIKGEESLWFRYSNPQGWTDNGVFQKKVK